MTGRFIGAALLLLASASLALDGEPALHDPSTVIVDVARSVADRVADALHAGDVALLLGGDRTIELGSIAGG